MNRKITSKLFAILFTCTSVVCAQQIYTNGPIATGTISTNLTAAPAGYSWSELQTPNASLGLSAYYNNALTTNFALADDFVVPAGETWNISSLDVFGYQTSYAGTTIPIDAIRVRIWNDDPSLGTSTVVFGDMTTNVLNAAGSGEEFVYRTATTTGTTRKVWRFNANVTASLTAGTYWVEFQVHATNDASLFFPPVTILNTLSSPTWNGKQRNVAAWASTIDGGSTNVLAIPFKLNGVVLGLDSNEFSSKIVMYPNPVKNNLTISNPVFSAENFIEIFDMTGRTVFTSNAKYETNFSIDVSNLKTGNYIVKLTTENGTAVKNFIKI